MTRAHCFWVFAVLCACPELLFGQQGQVPVVLHMSTSTRVSGMNGAGVALVGDAGAVFENPAGLATIRHIAVEGSFRSTPQDGTLSAAAIGWRVGQFDVGLGGRLLRYGPVLGERSWDGLAVGSLVYRFGLVALGVSGKYVRRQGGGTRTYAMSGDVGVAIAVFDIMALAFAIQNVGGNWQDTSSLILPRMTRVGFTMNYTDPQEGYRLLSTLEIQWREGQPARGVVGVEAGFVLQEIGVLARAGFAGRAGVVGSARFTVGGTLSLDWFDVDYARRPDDLAGEVAHVLGVRIRL